MKKKLIILISLIFAGGLIGYVLIATTSSSSSLSCSVKTTSCDINEVDVFHLSSLTNAHAELPSQTYYPDNKVCCGGVTGLGVGTGAACSAPNYPLNVALTLSGVTNAHVEQNTEINYLSSNDVCLLGGEVDCLYQAANCPTEYACLASISSSTNAHLGDCNAYSTKVCCKVVTINGDLNGDCSVNILDLIIVGNAFGSSCNESSCSPGYSCWGNYTTCTISGNWNPRADLKKDGKINVLDLSIIGMNFGNEC